MSTFSNYEIQYLSDKRPDLVPMEVPSLSNAPVLNQPSVDQIILKFLEKYEVNVKPRNVGEWNGWDTMYTFTRMFAKEGSTLNIASTMFYTNRSNQINSAAQDWGIWKRWALDHENFDQFKIELIQSIDFYNKKIIEETKTKIRIAETRNYKALLALREPSAKEYIAELLKQDVLRRKLRRRNIIYSLLFLMGLVSFIAIMETESPFLKVEENNKGLVVFKKKLRISKNLRDIKKAKKKLISKNNFSYAKLYFNVRNYSASAAYHFAVLERDFTPELYSQSKDIIRKFIISFMQYRNSKLTGYTKKNCEERLMFQVLTSIKSIKTQVLNDKVYWSNYIKYECDKITRNLLPSLYPTKKIKTKGSRIITVKNNISLKDLELYEKALNDRIKELKTGKVN